MDFKFWPRDKKDEPKTGGGCGNPECRSCYNEDGSLRGDDRIGFINGGITVPLVEMVQSEDFRSAVGNMSRRMEEMASGGFLYGNNARLMVGADMAAEQKVDPRAELKSALDAARKPVDKYVHKVSHTLDWEAVIGNDRAKEELRDVIEASTANAELHSFYGIKAPSGVMLFGPPGCGKTMFAKATAAALGRVHADEEPELMIINGMEIESPIFSLAGKAIDAVFAYARAYLEYHGRPLVIFIDEADALLRNRERFPISGEVVSAFLAGMDGMQKNGAFVLLATNRPDEIDQAILRDGRIDLKIKVERPTIDAAKTIAGNAMAGAIEAGWLKTTDLDFIDHIFSNDFLLQELVNPESGARHRFLLGHIINGAMVVGMVERAKRIAFRRDKASNTTSGVGKADLFEAVQQVYDENKGLRHDYALIEFVREIALPAEAANEAIRSRWN